MKAKKTEYVFVFIAYLICFIFVIFYYRSNMGPSNPFGSNLSQSLGPSERDVVEMSEWDRLADAARKAIHDKGINTPQSEKAMAQLLNGRNVSGISYIADITGRRLVPHGDFEFIDPNYDLHYTVSFDGTNILVHEPDLQRPFIKPLNANY